MKTQTLKTLVGTAAATVCLLGVTGQAANAMPVEPISDWDYAIDSFNDGYNLGTIGANSGYEFYGMAIKEDTANNSILVALNANMPLAGNSSSHANDGHIGWGDLMFNFSGDNLDTANTNRNLFGIRFAPGTDSGVGMGVYSDVKAKTVTGANSGFEDLEQHQNKVKNKGGTATMADLAQTDPYFAQKSRPLTSIKSGTKIGDVNILSDISGLGIDFGQFGAIGNHTFGFSFDKSLLPVGDFVAHLFAECANDGMAIEGEFQMAMNPDDPNTEVPEPTGTAALALLGLSFVGDRLRKHRAMSA